ncbi:MAG TPA: hypothetical protein PKH24_10360 [Sedimentisphaerales bacterium]|nr:hypothetical protein [Sedimentisphaerales bacterium]HNU29531.1 hypothetical protein [Sedimentisphaerales bacterium]
MIRAKKLAFYLLAVSMAGCVPIVSLHPLFTKDEIAFDEKLVGTWVDDVNDPKTTWEFSRLDDSARENPLLEPWQDDLTKLYRLVVTDDENHKGSFYACFVKLGERRFLDVFADRFPSGEQDPEKMSLIYNVFFFQPVHTFLRVDAIGEKLTLRMTDDDKFKELIQAEPNAVKHEVIDKRPILTASTKDLQAFVTKYAGDERLFPSDITLIRKTQ